MNEYFVIGNPVEHSVSPQIHNTIFEYYGSDNTYEKIKVEKEDLKALVAEFVKCGKGFNITVPHKSNIIPYLDGISPEARKVNAVNTVVMKNGLAMGYNTDIKGFALQAKNSGCKLKGSRVKIIGAGGAARAIAYSVFKEGASSVTVYNRTLANAEDIAAMIYKSNREENMDCICEAKKLEDFDAGLCDVLINATSVGLGKGHEDEMPVKNLEDILPDTVLFDAIYNPVKTRLMREVERYGNKVFNGLDMLIYQGAIANDIWCGFGAAKNRTLINKIRKKLISESY